MKTPDPLSLQGLKMIFRMACVLIVAVFVEGGDLAARLVLAFMLVPFIVYVCGSIIICIALSCGGDEHFDYIDEIQTPHTQHVIRTRPADAQECPICLAHAEAPIALACGHAFHAACVTRWLNVSTRATCPMCRTNQLM